MNRHRVEDGLQPNTVRLHDGYPAIADFVASDADGETLVFRTFVTLTVRQLLYLESELIELERQQQRLDEEAWSSGDVDLRLSLRTCRIFVQGKSLREEGKKRLELSNQIEAKLEQYHQTLLRQSRIARLAKPGKTAIKACRAMMMGVDGKDAKLGGGAETMFDEEYEDDLVALAPAPAGDALSKFLKNHWYTTRASQPHHLGNNREVRYFKANLLALIANICSIAIAAALLIGPIIVLYFVTDPDARLALVVIFVVLFAIGLSISTGATRDAVFAATAAYTAILVVFVSGDLGKARKDGQ